MLTTQQTEFFWEHGYIHIPNMFTPEHLAALREDMDWMIDAWATRFEGWTGPWRKQYMDDKTEAASQLIAMHDLHFYSEPWMRAATLPALTDAMADLLGREAVELHHTTMHVKPPETGHPFPMHQDWAFYEHDDERYIDVLVHLDDTSHENGEIRFVDGSHKLGILEHVRQWEGEPCTPHLSRDDFDLKDTVPVPAKAGDVVCFNIRTIHGSYINQTTANRRLVRMGYKHPDNRQTGGQSVGRPGPIVFGRRGRAEGQPQFSTGGPAASTLMVV